MTPYFQISTILYTCTLLLSFYLGIYITLQLIDEQKPQSFKSKYIYPSLKFLSSYFTLIAACTLSIMFLTNWPIVYLVLLVVISVFGFNHIRDYLEGKILTNRFDQITPGSEFNSNGQVHKIEKVGRFGLFTQTVNGKTFIPYGKLDTSEISIIDDYGTPLLCKLKISWSEELHLNEINEVLFSSPFVSDASEIKMHFSERNNYLILELSCPNRYSKVLLVNHLKNLGYKLYKK